MNTKPIVEVHDLAFVYPPARKGGDPHRALRGISFSVAAGEIFGLLGPNGGGKTTLFRILSTLALPSGGSVSIAGWDVRTQAHAIREHLGVAFQSPSLDKKLTVEENLRHQGHLYGMYGVKLSDRIRQMLERFGLVDKAHDLAETLSGGMARRVELAKTLLHGPVLLLLDEPSTGLDPGARRDLWNQLRQLQARDGVTVLLTTHLMEEAAQCTRLALLHRGEIVALGSPDQLTAEIGGDVITVHTPEPEELQKRLEERFDCSAVVLDGAVRIERSAGHQFIPQVVEAFPGQIMAITLGKPTLEDVFIHRTGHRLWEDNLTE
jgi:ABC-2 type transport system ATP-binding protein